MQQQQFDSQADRQQKTIVNAARLLTSAPDQYRPNVYQQMREGLSRFIPNLPEQYDDSVAQAAQSIVQAYSGADSAAPSGWRQFELTAQAAGLKPGRRNTRGCEHCAWPRRKGGNRRFWIPRD